MREKCRILFKAENGAETAVNAHSGESLLTAAKKAGVALDAPCGGRGTCGKCRVRVIEGAVSGERSGHITQEEIDDGWWLACAGFAETDVTVLVPESARAYQNRIKVSGKNSGRETAVFRELQDELKTAGLQSGIKLIKTGLGEPTVDDPTADRERLLRKLEEQTGTRSAGITLYALRKLPSALRKGIRGLVSKHGGSPRRDDCEQQPPVPSPQSPVPTFGFSVYCVLRQTPVGFTVIDILPGGETKAPVVAGLAIDIGTTTVAALLVDLFSGEILASGSAGNGQIRFGADVISRILISRIIENEMPPKEGASKANEHGGLERLRRAVTDETLVPLVASLCETAGITIGNIYRTAVAANTTMTHLFTGVDPAYLRLEPYVPAFFECGRLRGADLGLPVHPDAELVTAPAIGSYVGGDITAGVFASALFKKKELSLFLDLGTNGEIVLGNAEFMVSCACSAGPAFEGGDISCGMRATDGAIEACTVNPKTAEPQLTVIGPEGQKPRGVCGSGLIDLVGELFRNGIINAKGRVIKEGKRIRRDEWGGVFYIIAFPDESADGKEIGLSESDIDNFIRAKGSVFSAIRTMLSMLDLDVGAIEKVYVAGGIGGGINIRQAVSIGMLPNLPEENYCYIGNSSLHGAYSMLVSEQAAETVESIGRDMTYIELSTRPDYMDELVAACFLPHTDGELFKNVE